MNLNLSGKVACVAAASKGLGRASAFALAREGADLVIFSRTAADLDKTAAEIRKETGVRVVTVAGDAASAADVDRFITSATTTFGRLDILVTNAGGPPAGPFEKFSDEDWHKAIELTLMSVVRMVRGALPALKVQGGSIINIQSSSVKQPIPDLALSNIIRPGIVGLTKDLAITLASQGIRVNLIAPGRIDTDRVRFLDKVKADKTGVSIEAVKQSSEAGIPFGRYGQPDELGRVVAFVASDAASYMTGQMIMVDGGLVRSI